MPIAPKLFPTKTDLKRIETLGKYAKLYNNDQYSVLGLHELIKKQYVNEKDIVYLSHAIPARISDFYGDFVAGDPDKMIITAGDNVEANEKFIEDTVFENDIREMVNDIATDQSEFGYVPLLGWKDADNTYHIEIIPQDQYFPQPDGSVVLATYKISPESTPDNEKLWLLTRHYTLIGEDCVIETKAWKCGEGAERATITQEISLDEMSKVFGGRKFEATETIVGLNDIPIRQIDNGKRSKWGYGKSDYADIIPQLAEINERSTHISTQLLKNLDAKLQLPSSMANEDGDIDAGKDAYFVESKEEPEAKYIINANPLLEDARQQILQETKVISFVSGVPMFELLKSTMPERVESLRIQMYSAVRKAMKKRAKIKRALNDMFRMGFKMIGTDFNQDIKIVFSDVLPVDELVQAQTEAEKVTAGLTSKRSAIMRINGVSETQAEEEMAQIADESKIAGVMDSPAPVVPPEEQPIV